MNPIAKIKNMPPAAKASIAFFLSSLVTKGISYIVTPIYTRLLTEAQYGQVSVFMTWLEIFGIIAMFCLSYGVFNNGMVDHPEKRSEFSFSMLILSNIITLCFSGILENQKIPSNRERLKANSLNLLKSRNQRQNEF